MGPTPSSPLPAPPIVRELDAGFPVPSSSPAHISVPILAQAAEDAGSGTGSGSDAGSGSGSGAAPAPVDAGIDSVADLPAEVPDAGADVHFDAGQPLRK